MPRSFTKNVKDRKERCVFYKECKRTLRSLRSFIKIGKERKNVAFS